MNCQGIRRRRQAVTVTLVGFALAACTLPAPEHRDGEERLEPVGEAPKVEAVLDEMVAADGMSASQQGALLNELEQELANSGGSETRLRLAWLLSRPGSGFEDSARAAQLLEELMQSQSDLDQVVRDLARVVHTLLIERGKARSAVVQEQEAAATKIESLELQVSTLQTLLETMRQQLEALRDIETTIHERKPPEPELIPDESESPNSAGG